MGGEPFEHELKFPCADLDALEERLEELGADCLAPRGAEDNLVFDRDGELAGAGRLLRLRVDRHGVRLTFKGPATFEAGVKSRLEQEVGVSDAETMCELLESLGYRVVRRYQKRRGEWELDEVTVAVDETPLGGFVEFEGAGASAVAERCGFVPESAERRSYLQLWEDHRREHPDAPEDMVFP
ncbi:MAG: class IV adenylate cyclase [Thermoanaerobaculia bacterium]